jgi:cytochrome c5
MTIFSKFNRLLPRDRRGRQFTLAAAAVGLLVAAISCSSLSRQAVMLPDVPGAKYIGSAECEQCHEEITKTFPTAATASVSWRPRRSRGSRRLNFEKMVMRWVSCRSFTHF